MYLFEQIVIAVEQLHNAGHCHRNLKPDNIFLDKDINLCIDGLEFSKEIGQGYEKPFLQSCVGTMAY